MLWRVCSLNYKPLLRSFYCLYAFWMTSATVLHLLERYDAEEDGGIPQKERYADVSTSMQFTLVHLTGNYPITVYTLASKYVHVLIITVGKGLVFAFTGVFNAGFCHYLEDQRMVELQSAVLGRIIVATRTATRLQRSFRSRRQRRSAGTLSPPLAPSALQVFARDFKWARTPTGAGLKAFFNTVLILNVAQTIIFSIPEVDKAMARYDEYFEMMCTSIFFCF